MMVTIEEGEQAQMITHDNGIDFPFTIIKPKSRLPRCPILSSPGSVKYPTDGRPAIINIKDPAGGDKYLVNPMIPVYQRIQQRGLELEPFMRKLLDDYNYILLKHPEIAAYISSTGGGNNLPAPPPLNRLRLVPNMHLSNAEGNTLPDLCPPFNNMNLNSAPSSDIASISG